VPPEPRDHCPACGKPLPDGADIRRIYCNKACANTYFNDLAKAARLEARKGKTCKRCGEPFDAPRSGQQVFCAARCNRRSADEAYRRRLAYRPRASKGA
jgi:predicted nucleic acid-binding Zn ribbon protein